MVKAPEEIVALAKEIVEEHNVAFQYALEAIEVAENIKLSTKELEDKKRFMDQIAQTFDEIRIMGLKIKD